MHQVPCPFLLTTWGVSGKTWHQPTPNLPVPCCRFVRGTCKKTDGSCPFSHHVSKEKVSAVWSAGLLFQMFLGTIQPSDILDCIVFLGLKLAAATSSVHILMYSSSSPLHSHGPLCCAASSSCWKQHQTWGPSISQTRVSSCLHRPRSYNDARLLATFITGTGEGRLIDGPII